MLTPPRPGARAGIHIRTIEDVPAAIRDAWADFVEQGLVANADPYGYTAVYWLVRHFSAYAKTRGIDRVTNAEYDALFEWSGFEITLEPNRQARAFQGIYIDPDWRFADLGI
ncbi:hypothetical protein AB0N87_07760 [Streptomyces sp. NPDC093228]|jgi:hypothetical protein|uniref:hypothetical protein n=1 Tax=Streptomyces sp. NPDC093228 TaxID=3155070 RepID=UPI0034298A72